MCQVPNLHHHQQRISHKTQQNSSVFVLIFNLVMFLNALLTGMLLMRYDWARELVLIGDAFYCFWSLSKSSRWGILINFHGNHKSVQTLDPEVSLAFWSTTFAFSIWITNACLQVHIFVWIPRLKSEFTLNLSPPHHQSSNPREPGLNINRSRGRWNWLSVLTLPLPLPLDMKSIKNVHNSCDRIHVFDSPTIYNH